MRLLHGDCVEVMRGLPECSVDAIVTDPPYELGFMGKAWDGAGVAYSVTMWSEALRVLKPGGHLLAFGGTRTYHRMACAIEDAGFEIRDSIHWVYGSGFPKSLDIGKAIDKAAGAEREVVGSKAVTRVMDGSDLVGGNVRAGEVPVTAPATNEAKRWEGWGTALKPAHEPVVVARKPLVGTVASNVLGWGTGGLNIDGCRVGTREDEPQVRPPQTKTEGWGMGSTGWSATAGRWPANVVFDRAAGEALDQQSGTLATNKPVAWKREKETADARRVRTGYGVPAPEAGEVRGAYSDNGGASRFFTQADFGPDDWPFVYQAKPSRKERNAGLDGLPEKSWQEQGFRDNETTHLSPRAGAGRTSANANHHPTVKPVALMRHLVRLVTPPGGVVLDPFAGSGTTLVAAILEGFDCIGIEMTDEYLPIIEGRTAWAAEQAAARGPEQARLL